MSNDRTIPNPNGLSEFSSYPASMDELDQVEQDIADQKVLADYRKRED